MEWRKQEYGRGVVRLDDFLHLTCTGYCIGPALRFFILFSCFYHLVEICESCLLTDGTLCVFA